MLTLNLKYSYDHLIANFDAHLTRLGAADRSLQVLILCDTVKLREHTYKALTTRHLITCVTKQFFVTNHPHSIPDFQVLVCIEPSTKKSMVNVLAPLYAKAKDALCLIHSSELVKPADFYHALQTYRLFDRAMPADNFIGRWQNITSYNIPKTKNDTVRYGGFKTFEHESDWRNYLNTHVPQL